MRDSEAVLSEFRFSCFPPPVWDPSLIEVMCDLVSCPPSAWQSQFPSSPASPAKLLPVIGANPSRGRLGQLQQSVNESLSQTSFPFAPGSLARHGPGARPAHCWQMSSCCLNSPLAVCGGAGTHMATLVPAIEEPPGASSSMPIVQMRKLRLG